MNEQLWRQIARDPEYECTPYGDFRKFCHYKAKPPEYKLLKCFKGTRYHYVHINKKTFNAHRLIAETWNPNPENKPIVIFRDGNSENIRCDNLIWVTWKELSDLKKVSTNYAKGERSGRIKHSNEIVKECVAEYSRGIPVPVLMCKYRVSQTAIYSWINGFRRNYGTEQLHVP
jgi:HNH endonuclease